MIKRGFTLVELLVVIAIIGILAGIIIPNLGDARKSSLDARRISDIKQLQLALSLYYQDNGKYPTTLALLESNGYISKVPNDPSNNTTAYKYSALNASGGSTNCTLNPAVAYHLGAVMDVPKAELGNGDVNNTSLLNSPYTACSGSGANFHGKAANCSGSTPNSSDNCYDVVQN